MSLRLLEAISKLAEEVEAYGGETRKVLRIEVIEALARTFHIRPREIEICALDHDYVPARYLKNLGTVGIEGQKKLLESTVAVIGAGGIGGHVAEMLTRMGVGTIILADADAFEDSNLNRQTFATETLVGRSKVEAARERLWEINKSVLVVPHHVLVTEDSLPYVIGNADVVVDGLDTLRDRLTLQRMCAQAEKVMIHGAIAGSGAQVMTIFPGDRGLLDLYGGEGKDEISGIEAITGNPSTTPAVAAALQTHEAINILLGREPSFRHRLLFLDLDTATFEWIEPEGPE